MTKIEVEQARKKAIAVYREKHRPHRKPTTWEAVLLDVGCQKFADGSDAAVKVLAK